MKLQHYCIVVTVSSRFISETEQIIEGETSMKKEQTTCSSTRIRDPLTDKPIAISRRVLAIKAVNAIGNTVGNCKDELVVSFSKSNPTDVVFPNEQRCTHQ